MLLAGDTICTKVRVNNELSQSKLLFNVLCAGLFTVQRLQSTGCKCGNVALLSLKA